MDRTLLKSLLRMLADLQVGVMYMCTCKLMVNEWNIFSVSHTDSWSERNLSVPNRGQTYNLLVTRPGALPLSHRRLMRAKATKRFSWRTNICTLLGLGCWYVLMHNDRIVMVSFLAWWIMCKLFFQSAWHRQVRGKKWLLFFSSKK